jgi:para-aminobenzoate synthetase component 1
LNGLVPVPSYDRRVTLLSRRSPSSSTTSGTFSPVVLERFPALDGVRAADAAEPLRDLPGLALLESARRGRLGRWTVLTADPVAVTETPDLGAARRLLARLDGSTTVGDRDPGAPPFTGGLVGYLGYGLRTALEPRLATSAAANPRPASRLPDLRLGLHDWAVAWDEWTGHAWIGGRAVDGDHAALSVRLTDVRRRLADVVPMPLRPAPALAPFRSSLDRAAFEAGVEAVRDAIARGEIYQANLTRRLATPFRGDAWPLHRLLAAGDPSLFAAYLDLGEGRAIASASPEAFLRLDARGGVRTDPIKGTRRRGRTRAQDRALACELLASEKDRAENVMIVDVLRNDLGRVCVPGSVRVPRLCRLERTDAVQHLVSTVVGRLAPGRDAFDLLANAFPGGSITGAPKIRAMELLDTLEPVERGPYTGALGWIGADGAMATSILIRTFVADGRELSLHVGGGMTWRSDPAAEWDETVAKASGPLRAIEAIEDPANA